MTLSISGWELVSLQRRSRPEALHHRLSFSSSSPHPSSSSSFWVFLLYHLVLFVSSHLYNPTHNGLFSSLDGPSLYNSLHWHDIIIASSQVKLSGRVVKS